MYLQPTNRHWACDIEADDLLDKATRIWCAWLVNIITKERVKCLTANDLKAFQAEHPDAIYVGHNFIGYDAPMLNRFWNARIPISRIVDTFVLSQLYNPTMPGGHSLDIWGQRLRHPKTEFNDFSHLSDEMVKYCLNDTIVTAKLFLRLTDRMRSVGFTETGSEIEHLAWNIIQNKQKRHGFPFDYKKAHELYVELRAREEELKNDIYNLWPPRLERVGIYSRPFKKDGTRSANYQRHLEQFPRVVTGSSTYECYDYVAFNLGSPAQRIEKLLELGWEPVNKTKKGNPKVDEDELLAFAETSGKPEVAKLAKWIVVNSRANMVKTWLEAYNNETRAIHGQLFLASTLRYRHNKPNSANIPAVRHIKEDGVERIAYGEEGAWTYECRDLWTCGDTSRFSLLGIDGKGIQLRVLAHNVAKMVGVDTAQPFIDTILTGDPHKKNIETLGLANKPAAKKFFYTLIMGGRGGRLAADQAQFGTKMTAKEGEALREKMIASIPGFGELIRHLERQYDATGRIRLCDDTPILVPSPHMVIPYLLQGDESRLMKKALIYLDEIIRRNRWSDKVFKVADIHDEWQWKVSNDIVDDFVSEALPCFLRAGEFFDYLVPIEGDCKVGKTWAETH